ncbi:MAG: iron ABC transporter permease [Chloroflexota bacterium]|nr:iron ABC transporter permease [Chloroflexota bacterium]MDE2899186.1 iron ABC transporter permease [Chloroflexota bacterium]
MASIPSVERLSGSFTARRSPPVGLTLLALAVTALLLLPVIYLGIRSFDSGTEAWQLLMRPRIAAVIGRSLLLVVSVTVVATALAVPIAWLLTRTDLPGRRVWTVVMVLPLVIPSFVYALVAGTALGPRGLLQQGLEAVFGVPELPSIYGFPGALLALALLTYPYVLLPTMAALRRLDPALEEVSRCLGRGALRTFATVTLPALRPAIAAGALLAALYTLSDFGAVSLLRYETFTAAIFVQYQSAFDRAAAAALSLVLVAAAIAIVALEARSRGRSRYHALGPGPRREFRPIPLKRWRWPAVAGLGLVAFATTGGPAAVLVYWLLRGLAAGEALLELAQPLANSVWVSLVAAAILLVVAIPIGVLLVRYPSPIARLVERGSYVGFALPGITVAIAFIFFGINLARPIYQTLVLLLAAYVVLFLPTTLGAVRAGLLQVDPRTEEAARTLGKSPRQVLWRVTIPAVRGSLAAGAAMAFLLVMKELPAALLLGPIGFRTLATVTWAAADEAFFAQAASSSLLLILVASLPLALILARRGPIGILRAAA